MSEITGKKTLVRRAVKASGIQFNGKNGREVVQFINDYYGPGLILRNGGSYVSVSHENGGTHRIRKNDWVVVDANGGLVAPLSEDEFKILFNLKK